MRGTEYISRRQRQHAAKGTGVTVSNFWVLNNMGTQKEWDDVIQPKADMEEGNTVWVEDAR